MEKLAHILTNHLIRNNVVAIENRDIYDYGFQVGLEVCLNTIISGIIAVICHMELEAIIFFCIFIALRSYAGGLHLNTYIGCMVCSCLSLLTLLIIVKYLEIGMVYSIVVESISLFMIKNLAPVQNANRPVLQEEIRKFRQKLDGTIAKIMIVSIAFCVLKFEKLVQMTSMTTAFMVIILFLGKINYKKAVANEK